MITVLTGYDDSDSELTDTFDAPDVEFACNNAGCLIITRGSGRRPWAAYAPGAWKRITT